MLLLELGGKLSRLPCVHHRHDSSACLRRVALFHLEIGHALYGSGHVRDDGQLANDKINISDLCRCEVIGVSHDPEACNVSGTVAAVLAEKPGRVSVECAHRFHSHEVGVVNVFSLNIQLLKESFAFLA